MFLWVYIAIPRFSDLFTHVGKDISLLPRLNKKETIINVLETLTNNQLHLSVSLYELYNVMTIIYPFFEKE